MIALPSWMLLHAVDPRPESAHPQRVRATLGSARAAGYRCDYCGAADSEDVYLVGSGDQAGRLVVDRDRGSLELWDEPADPNGAPFAWRRFDPAKSVGAAEATALLHSAWT